MKHLRMHYMRCPVCGRLRLITRLKDGTKVIRTHREAPTSVPLHLRALAPRCLGSGKLAPVEKLRCVS